VDITSLVPLVTESDFVDAPTEGVYAGFPSPAEDLENRRLDLNEHLVKNPPSTFFIKCDSNAMIDAGIFPGDLLIVDRSVKPESGCVVVADVDGDFVVRRLRKRDNGWMLFAESEYYSADQFNFSESQSDMELDIWGVVRYVIHDPNG
jgi:DNA polymerase V